MVRLDDDEAAEKHLRFLSRCFVSCIKNSTKEEAEELCYINLKLLYVAKEAIKYYKNQK